jgi:hypothetical protein
MQAGFPAVPLRAAHPDGAVSPGMESFSPISSPME